MFLSAETAYSSAPEDLKLRVLLADDTPMIRLMVGALLKKIPYIDHVETAEDGDKAIEMVTEEKVPYDLILMDMNMTRVHGPEATVAIRDIVPSDITKIIRHSTETDEKIVDMTPEPHKSEILSLFDGQLPKPFLQTDLTNLIEKIFPLEKERAIDIN